MELENTTRTTTHSWCNDHYTDISACGMWGASAEIQVSKWKFHTHIYLD